LHNQETKSEYVGYIITISGCLTPSRLAVACEIMNKNFLSRRHYSTRIESKDTRLRDRHS